MPTAPMNGSAPSSFFNDRRGTNPFQPVQSAMAKAPAVQMAMHSSVKFGGDSYLGQGQSNPNGALPPTVINGHTYTRDNPDVLNFKARQFEAGQKAGL